MTFQTGNNLYQMSRYIVAAPPDFSPYPTVQSAINAANAAGGGVVYIREGTFTEDLTLYDGVAIQGAADTETTIIGVHTPPDTGAITIFDVTLESPTDIISSVAAGTTNIAFDDCQFNLTNGYIFNLPNWTGPLQIYRSEDVSTNNGIANNTGGSTLDLINSIMGGGTNVLTKTDGRILIFNTRISCPITTLGTCTVQGVMGAYFLNTVTIGDTSTATFSNSYFSTGANQALIQNSTGTVNLADVSINSSNNPAIGGTGAGNLLLGSVTFLDNQLIAGTVTKVYTTRLETGILKLDDTTVGPLISSTGVVSGLGAMTDGQLVIGSTGVDPVLANLASAGGTVTITNGAGTINLEAGASIPTTFNADAGSATPALNILTVSGGANISTSGAGSTVTIDLSGTTDHAVQVGNASGSLTSLVAGTTGELLIGNTGADPAFGSTAYGDFSFSNILAAATHRSLSVVNTVADATSHADLRLSVAPAGGDAMVSWEVQGTLFYAMGVDNSDSDIWKLTTSSDPSSATTAIAVDNGTAAVKFANAYEFPIADGTTAYPLVTDGGGNLDFTSLTVAGGGTGVTSITDHALIVGSGTAAITEIGPLTDGQLVIGSTGVDPVASTLTAGTGVSITNAAGSITINSAGGGFTWNVETGGTATIAANNGYIGNNAGGVTFTLPATAAVGDRFIVTGLQASWTLAQNAGQTVYFGSSSSTTGVGGSLASTHARDVIEFICVVANNDFQVLASIGNITVT